MSEERTTSVAATEAHHGRAGRLGHIELPESDFAQLATGGGGPDVIGRLRAAERSRRLVMLRAFLDITQENPDAGPASSVAEAWEALERAEASDPDAVTEVLMHPQVGNWLAYTLRRHRGGARSATPFFVDVGQLHAVAIAACAATGQAYAAAVPLRAGRVMLPTLGMATLPGQDVAQVATEDGRIWLGHGDARVSVPPDGSDAPGWWALRRVTVGADPQLRVWLDDLDPMRDLADPVPPARLSVADFQRWESLLRDAWAILVARHRPIAEALAAGVTSLVPLPAGDGWGTRSASTGEAFGAIMCSPPPDAVTLAVSLAHEFMHIKLGGLMHLFSLTGEASRPRLYAPWRDDPRPAGGLLQGIYAFFGIAAFWRRERSATDGILGDFEYAYARAQTHEALDIALRDGGLTEHGRRFAEQLSGEMRRWSSDDINPKALRLAGLVADGHRAGWRIRHSRPRPEDVAALVQAWDAGASGGVVIGASEVLPDPEMRHWSAARLGLARRSVIAPDRLREARSEDWGAALSDADLALYSGESAKAAAGFRDEIRTDPESPDAWTGLGLALRTDPEAPAPAAVALLTRPEVVRAVHREIAGDHSPVELAAWIGSFLRG
jgi:HEXXH motif-containing protein